MAQIGTLDRQLTGKEKKAKEKAKNEESQERRGKTPGRFKQKLIKRTVAANEAKNILADTTRDFDEKMQKLSDALSKRSENPVPTWNLAEHLRNDPDSRERLGNFQIQDVDFDTGDVTVFSEKQNKTGTINAKTVFENEAANVAEKQGIDPDKAVIEINTPDTAVNKSPLTFQDRLAVNALGAGGNISSKMKYLANRYDDVKPNQSGGGLSVKENGVWYQVDPQGLGGGDAHEMAREFTSDIVDLSEVGSDIALSTGGGAAGAAAGAAVGGPIGGLAGFIIGEGAGQAASSTIRTSMGRVVRTYEPKGNTLEEKATNQLRDIGDEMMLGMGGAAIGAGVVPGTKAFARAAKNIGKKASNSNKEIMSAVFGNLNATGQRATRNLLDNPDQWKEITDSAAKRAGTNEADKVKDILLKDNANNVTKFFKDGKKAFNRKLEALKGSIRQKAAKQGFNADANKIVNNAFDELSKKGFGKVEDIEIKGVRRTPAITLSGKRVTKPATTKDQDFVLFDKNQFLKNLPEGVGAPGEETLSDLNKVIGELKDLKNIGKLTGAKGAKKLMDLRQAIGRVVDSSMPRASRTAMGGEDKILKNFLADFRTSITKQIDNSFSENNLINEVDEFNKTFADLNQPMDEGLKLADKQNVETVVRSLFREQGTPAVTQDLFNRVADLQGDAGRKLLRRIEMTETARRYTDRIPQLNFTGVGGLAFFGAMGAGGTIGGAIGGPAGISVGSLVGQALGAAGSTPRALARGASISSQMKNRINIASKGLDFVKGLSPEALDSVLKSREGVAGIMNSINLANERANQTEDNLVQNAIKSIGEQEREAAIRALVAGERANQERENQSNKNTGGQNKSGRQKQRSQR